ncbi:hypothetical protein [Aquitalea sp. ASV15]|uniref:hypothetical protein n=1 Tax=Aquitalea sp. ASV15 TaxID=2795104 RepID=UPI0018EA5C96|nr:hypothetical protein [Aquitalea sp. ASV15]
MRFLFLLLILHASLAAADEVPPHLQLARQLLEEVSPARNSYQHNGWVRWKGDWGLFGRVSEPEVKTDCSGLIDALFERLNSQALTAVQHGHWKAYPKAENYYEAIAASQGFIRRAGIGQVQPGDIFAAKYQNEKDTGHVMIINALPQLLNPQQKPQIDGTVQWAVEVIDSSGPHWKGDTRYREDGSQQTGIGRGTIRLYTLPDGSLAGWAWSLGPGSHYRDHDQLAIGQPRYQ